MSLRRRIAGAAALAVAAVAVTLGVVGYLSTRSSVIGSIQDQLRARAAMFLQPHGSHDGGPGSQAGPGGPSQPGGGPKPPGAPRNGGAAGLFQFVRADGGVQPGNSGAPKLPVDARVRAIAGGARDSFFTSATVAGTHEEIYTVGDPYDHYAVQVALPLTSADSILHSLLLTYAALVGAGVLLAGVFGALIARSALAPIERFSRDTERVAGDLERPRHLEQAGATELRRLAGSFNATLDALERSIQAQRHLIADASHELRTPMAALRSNIQIFLESERLPEDERESLQQAIIAELDDLTQLVADVVELARGATPSGHTEAIELDQIVAEAVARAQRRGPGLEFSSELEPTPIVNAADRVTRAVTNVIDNARKWSPPDGRIEVVLRDGELSIRDHGPGFGETDLPHVFDRFYRAEAARRMPGSGLGLAIVKQAAEAYGGSVQAANAPGGGAILRVRFGSAAPTAAT
jgi:two-component system sensor histidine kinase MprB